MYIKSPPCSVCIHLPYIIIKKTKIKAKKEYTQSILIQNIEEEGKKKKKVTTNIKSFKVFVIFPKRKENFMN